MLTLEVEKLHLLIRLPFPFVVTELGVRDRSFALAPATICHKFNQHVSCSNVPPFDTVILTSLDVLVVIELGNERNYFWPVFSLFGIVI
jgi:hypothetical protein